jgi:sialate O-acetylesterase
MKMHKPLTGMLLWTLGLAGIAAAAEPARPLLHAMFQDHAVLQRDAPIRVYGWAAPNANVRVMLADHSVQAGTDANGHWQTSLPALPAGGPFTLTATTDDGTTQSARDVLIGDVWLCSGQSNMVLQVHRALDARSEIAGSANDRIRLLNVGENGSVRALDSFATAVAWKKAEPGNTPDFSATCFYYARELQKTIDVPMGLIVAAWGGSRIQSWISASTLRAHGVNSEGLDVLQRYASDPLQATAEWGRLWGQWWASRPGIAPGDEPWNPRRKPGIDWRIAPATLGAWERWGVAELADFNGMLWYRTTVVLNAAQAAQSATLALGSADEVDIAWVNGRSVGSSYGGDARDYPLARGLLQAGENVIVVNVLDTYKDGGLAGPGSAHALRFADGSSVPLDGEWKYRIVPAEVGSPPRAPWHTAGGLSTLYNGMISPIGRYGLRGFVWYQGEANTFDAASYGGALKMLLADWRERFGFGASLPFLNVQLANYGAAPTRPVESGWAELREVQRRFASQDAHYGHAVAIDIGDRYDIHPPNKQELGRRLARLARHLVYGEKSLHPSGPVPVAATHEGDAVQVRFADITGGLVAYGADGPLGFELCGAGPDSCRYADARIRGDTVWLRAAHGADARRVRYGWADSPVVTLFDAAGLPAGPFELSIER